MVRELLMRSHFCLSWYRTFKAVADAYLNARFEYGKDDDKSFSKLHDDYCFDNRSVGHDSLLIILAGYKPQLWPDIFNRVKRFIPDKMDVCVVSTGREVSELNDLCKKNGWSYLSTHRNCLTLSQNIAIHLHPSAEWIYKMDEDIFLTEGCLSRMMKAYSLAESSRCDVGFVAPLINVNGYGHVRLLEKLSMTERWIEKFGDLSCGDEHILRDPNAAIFMWQLGSVDSLNSKLSAESPNFSICPYRFSIGCILFSRAFWKEIEMFTVSRDWIDLGRDEEQMCSYCMLNSRGIVVCENALVGHLAFGPQTKDMLEFHATGKCK